MSRYDATYTLDLSDFRDEDSVIKVKCLAIQVGEIWQCSFAVTNSELPLTFRESKAVKKTVYPVFRAELEKTYGPIDVQWEGEKRHALLQFKVGDTVKYSGTNHEVVYVIPETEKCGLRTHEGRLLNNIQFSEIQLALLKKQ